MNHLKRIRIFLKSIKNSRLYRFGAKIIAIIVLIGGIHSGIQVITGAIHNDLFSERRAYKGLSLGRSIDYVDTLFGTPLVSNEISGIGCRIYETKHTYLSALYDNETLIGFFSFLKESETIQLPYELFPKALGKFTYSDMAFPATYIDIDVQNGNMGYALYAEHHGSGRWGYYYDYIIGDCSIGAPINDEKYIFEYFSPMDTGRYYWENFGYFNDEIFMTMRDNSYPNFAGIIQSDYDIEFPTVEFYLALCDTADDS